MLVASSTHGGEKTTAAMMCREILSSTRGVGERLVALKYVPIEYE
jgi:hypothetical protein